MRCAFGFLRDTTLAVAFLVTLSNANVIFEGRVSIGTSLATFDTSASQYNPTNVLGQNQKFSTVLLFPDAPPSLFDASAPSPAKPFMVTIDDQSIFNPGTPQNGFRRTELIPATNTGTDATVQGVTTHHFSILTSSQQAAAAGTGISKPLNFSHEYQVVFIETNDFASHVFTIVTGTTFNTSPVPAADAQTLKLEGSTAGGATGAVLFETPFTEDVWNNFAVTIDWDNNLLTAFFSTNNDPLALVVKSTPNNASGKGQFHVGLLKLPLPPSNNVVLEGTQESGIDEGLTFGGVFVETGSATLS